MTQFARPSSDTTVGDWTTAPLWSKIDDTANDATADSDFISSPTNPNGTVTTIKLSSITDPQSSTGHVMRWRYSQDSAGGTAVTIAVELWQTGGAAAIAATTVTTTGTAWTVGTLTLSTAQADSITDYTALELRVDATGGGGSPSNRRAGRISMFWLETPDAPANQNYSHSDTASLSFSGAVSKQAGRALTAALSFAGSLARQVRRGLAGSLGFTGQMQRSTSRPVTGDLTFSTTFSTTYQPGSPSTPALVAVLIHTE